MATDGYRRPAVARIDTFLSFFRFSVKSSIAPALAALYDDL
jgi:hypothetical protein